LEERDEKLCWYEFCLTPEIFRAMDISFLGEIHPPIMSLGAPDVCWKYVDIAQENGTPSDLCVLDKFMFGALLSNEMPKADFMVTASGPCDSSRIGYQMFEPLTHCPVYRLDAPADDSPEAHAYSTLETQTVRGRSRYDIRRHLVREEGRYCESHHQPAGGHERLSGADGARADPGVPGRVGRR
jgi:hypothetical protein